MNRDPHSPRPDTPQEPDSPWSRPSTYPGLSRYGGTGTSPAGSPTDPLTTGPGISPSPGAPASPAPVGDTLPDAATAGAPATSWHATPDAAAAPDTAATPGAATTPQPAAARPASGPGAPANLGRVGIVTTVVVLLCFALGPSAYLLGNRYFEDGEPVPRGRATSVPTLTGDPFVSPSPETPPAKLRDLEPVSVVGPTWEPGEKTYTFAFRNVPFAFRGGATWGCMSGNWEKDDGTPIEGLGWRCIDEKAGKKRPQVDILIRPCEEGCGPEQQAKLDSDWLDEPVSYVRRDPTTRYAESTEDGTYTLVVSHFFGDEPGGKPRYQVALMVECRPVDKAVTHKVVNDIRTQSG